MQIPCSRAPRCARVIGTLLCTLAFVGCGSLDEASAVPEQGTLDESKAPVVHGLDDVSTLASSYTYSAKVLDPGRRFTEGRTGALLGVAGGSRAGGEGR